MSLGLSNFAAAIGIGVAGTDARTRLRVGLAFGLFEAGCRCSAWPPAGQPTGRLLITGLALSIDNLAVGFALGTYHVSHALATIIGTVTVTLSLSLSLARLQLGAMLGVGAAAGII